MKLLIVLSILVSICAVHSQDIYGNIDAVKPHERQYVQSLVDLPKPLDLSKKIRLCGKSLAVGLVYLCPSNRRSHPREMSSVREKRQIADECCVNECTLDNYLLYCPQA
ncbi:unnamed protein product [Euphydryas editha]|uniref:Insulin-like domain-containing protein n=1 Tax=Euphydryas editha TaxID=104508 RepID=A0AAU9VEH1_EUPED|nr:unnamed protein product [Euphydryas editha]